MFYDEHPTILLVSSATPEGRTSPATGAPQLCRDSSRLMIDLSKALAVMVR